MATAIVTGASSGIGAETAKRLGREGYDVVLVARREDRLRQIASEIGSADVLALDITSPQAPEQLRAHVGGRDLRLLVNNAGAAWRGTFAETGWENVRRHMELNFDAQVRITEALLELLRANAPSAIVNVASTAGRIGRYGSGSYSASKFALAGWSDSLFLEEREHGVHVGLVLPGFVATEGFPQQELRDRPATRWIVSTPDKVAQAIVECADGKAERYVPRAYGAVPVLRALAPRLLRRAGSGNTFTPSTSAKDD